MVSDEEYEETVKIVDRFEHGIGKELNFKLHEKAKYMRNWVSRFDLSCTIKLYNVVSIFQ